MLQQLSTTGVNGPLLLEHISAHVLTHIVPLNKSTMIIAQRPQVETCHQGILMFKRSLKRKSRIIIEQTVLNYNKLYYNWPDNDSLDSAVSHYIARKRNANKRKMRAFPCAITHFKTLLKFLFSPAPPFRTY